jgi:hypothetical protein
MALADAFPTMRPSFAIKAWDGVPVDINRAEIRGNMVKDFAPLLRLKKLRSLEALCDTPAQVAIIAELNGLESLALEHLGKGLEKVGRLSKLKALKLFAFKAGSLAGLEGLTGLRYLDIEHAPKMSSLAPLRTLKRLEWLSISTLASWDASRKTIKVESLEPLSGLTHLRFLSLRGVEPISGGLAPLAGLHRLEELVFSHVYSVPMEDYARLAAALPKTKGDCLVPYYRLSTHFACKACKDEELVWLTGAHPRTKHSLCPKCEAGQLADHVAAFEKIRRKA